MTSRRDAKPWPSLRSDEEAERFVAEADLSEYDWSRAVPAEIVLGPHTDVELRLPSADAKRIERAAAATGRRPDIFLALAIRRALDDALADEDAPAEAAE